MGKENREKYYKWLKPLAEQMSEDTPSEIATKLYIADFNLSDELDNLPKASLIYDLGCGYGGTTQGLQKRFPNFRFVGVDIIVPQPAPPREIVTVPVLQGSIDDLADGFKDGLLPSLYPPNVILTRNVLQLLELVERTEGIGELVNDALTGLHKALPLGGKTLIYDGDAGYNTYRVYSDRIDNLGLGFSYEEKFNRNPNVTLCPTYLRLDKIR